MAREQSSLRAEAGACSISSRWCAIDRSENVRYSVGPSGKHLKPQPCLELTSRTPSWQRSCATATTDRTYDRKRSVRTLLQLLQAGGRRRASAAQPFAQDRGDDRLRLYSASSSRRYSIPAGVKAIVCCARAIDPEAAVLRLHLVNHLPQETLVLAKDFSGVTDGDCGSRRRHIRQRGQQPSRGANSTVIGRPIQ